jgi:hypothetical protein
MPSKLEIKVRNPETGKEEMKTITIHRCWQDGTSQVWLHADGTYGDKLGHPVKDESELDIIEDPRQHKRAMRWWETRGKALASKLYGPEDYREEEEEPEHFYIAYPAGDEKPDTMGMDWLTLGFQNRPDWWGKAKTIQIEDTVYALEEEPEEKEPAKKAEKKPDKKEKEPVNF